MNDLLAVEGVKRQRRGIAEKLAIVEQTLQPGASVARVAQQYGINANQIFNWRRLYQRGLLSEKAKTSNLLPVRIAAEAAAGTAEPTRASGSIYVEFGKARIRIEGRADKKALGLVLEYLLR